MSSKQKKPAKPPKVRMIVGGVDFRGDGTVREVPEHEAKVKTKPAEDE